LFFGIPRAVRPVKSAGQAGLAGGGWWCKKFAICITNRKFGLIDFSLNATLKGVIHPMD
jgi:hypothetical protein